MTRKQESGNRKNVTKMFSVYCCLLLLTTLPVLWNLLRPGFYPSHDGEWMVIRLTAFHQALKSGQFPVRWLPRLNHGYGYPVMNFLYPLPFYLAGPFYILTKNPATAVQIVMGLSIIAMAVGMYCFASEKRKAKSEKNQKFDLSAFVASIVYVYSPYVAYNLYQRGSLGELVAMGIAPWVFWALRAQRWSMASLLLAALITSHNVVAMLFVPIVFGYAGILGMLEKRKNLLSTIYRLLFAIILALGLSSFFWFPALSELKYVRASTISVSDFQNEYLSFPLAVERTGIVPLVFTGGAPLFLFTKTSAWFWGVFLPLQVIQFPWRLLSLFSFAAAVVVTKLLTYLRFHISVQRFIGILIVGVSLVSSVQFLHPKGVIDRPPSYYETNDDSTTVRAEYTPVWVKELPKERPSTSLTYFYPGWRAFIDGRPAILADPQKTGGTLSLLYPSTPGEVRFVWGETSERTFANMTSVISALCLLLWYQGRKKPHETSG